MKNKKIKNIIFGLSISALLGMSSNVFAATTHADALPDTVTRGAIAYRGGQGITLDNTSSMPFYQESNDGKYLLYCFDRKNNSYDAGDVLSKDKKVDYKYAALLKKAYPINTVINPLYGQVTAENTAATPIASELATQMTNVWITQVALWNLQGTINNTQLSTGADGDSNYLSFVSTDSTMTYDIYTDSEFIHPVISNNLWNNYVTKLVTNIPEDPANSQLSVKMDGKLTNDGTNEKTGLISVSVSNTGASYSTYSLSFTDAPDGVKVYTEAGAEVTDVNNIPVGTKIYLVIPKKSVTEGKSFTVTAKANITYDAAYQYVDKVNNHQPSILVGPETKEVSANLLIVPDTASSVSRSIYFVGFIILLSGAGIIYANVKPKKEEA